MTDLTDFTPDDTPDADACPQCGSTDTDTRETATGRERVTACAVCGRPLDRTGRSR
jgi:rRNA maturation endonuclease Nob1